MRSKMDVKCLYQLQLKQALDFRVIYCYVYSIKVLLNDIKTALNPKFPIGCSPDHMKRSIPKNILPILMSVEFPIPALYGIESKECQIKIPGPQFSIRSSCDRHQLAATHTNMQIVPLLAVLKGIVVVADATNPENQKHAANKKGNRSTPASQTPPSQPIAPKSGSDISHILGTSEGTNATEEESVQPDTP